MDSIRIGKMTIESYAKMSSDLDPINTTYITFKENGKMGLKYLNNSVIIKPKYEYLSEFQHGVASVKFNGKSGLINFKDSVIIQFGKYDDIYMFKGKRARVRKSMLFGIIDEYGKEIIPCIYKSADNFSFELCQVTDKNNKMGIINLNGSIVIPFIYDSLVQFHLPGLIKAKLNDKWGFINYKGEILINIEYDLIELPSYGTITVKKDGKFGYIDIYGKKIIPFIYDKAYPFTESGQASIMKNGKWGLVFLDGTEKMY